MQEPLSLRWKVLWFTSRKSSCFLSSCGAAERCLIVRLCLQTALNVTDVVPMVCRIHLCVFLPSSGLRLTVSRAPCCPRTLLRGIISWLSPKVCWKSLEYVNRSWGSSSKRPLQPCSKDALLLELMLMSSSCLKIAHMYQSGACEIMSWQFRELRAQTAMLPRVRSAC